MNHPNEESIERKLKELPKPKLNTDVKNKIYFSLMEDAQFVEKRRAFQFDTRKLVFSFVGILTFIIFSFAMITLMQKQGNNTNTHSFTLTIDDKDKVNIKSLIPYRESYVGDNSAVGGILRQLPGKDYFKGLSLSTNKEPYGIHVDYHSNKKGVDKYWSGENSDRIFLYNATTLFILVRNVDEVSFDVKTNDGTRSFHASRKELENFYGVPLRELSNSQTQWEELLKNTFTDKEKVKSFYDKQIFNNVVWTLSPTFQSDKSTSMIGKKGRLGLFGPDTAAKKVDKFMWGFWGSTAELQGPVKIVGMKKDTEQLSKILYETDLSENVWESNIIMGPVHGADMHTPCNMIFPSSGIWCLYVYLNNKPFDYIVVKVH